MEGEEVMVNGGISNGGCGVSYENGVGKEYCENGIVVGDVAEKVRGNLAEEVLVDLEEYWDDINDRLMISRVVSESLIKGMVSAVEQEAAERIEAKDLEVAFLKERLQSHEETRLPDVQKHEKVGNENPRIFSCATNSSKKHEKIREDLDVLRNLAREQLKKVTKEFELARGSNSMKKIGSVSELVGLGGILPEKQSESWMHVDNMLDSLKTTMDTICRNVDDLLLSSSISSCESQHDLDLLSELDDVEVQTENNSLNDEFEENYLEQNAQFFGTQNINWFEKFNEISSLRSKLDAVLKFLSMPDAELISHGSHDLEHSHHKAFSNHVTLPTALNGENGTDDPSNVHVAEIYDIHQLNHLSNKELVDYFNGIITKLKRDHESDLYQKTEEYFRLKRDFLKEKGYSMTHRKDEEFDILRKEIPKVLLKLDDFLLENERFPVLTNNLKSMEKLKQRLEILLSKNRDLRNCMAVKENEIKHLKMQVSDASEKLLQRSLAEEKMLKCVVNLNSAAEDSCIEASLSEDIYKFSLREQISQTKCDSEVSNMEMLMSREIYDIILWNAATPAETANRYEIQDSDIELSIMQALDGLLLTEAIKDARQQIGDLFRKVVIDDEMRICLETKILEKEDELRHKVEENEKLKLEVLGLKSTVTQKKKLTLDLSVKLSKTTDQFELASQGLINVEERANQLNILVTESNKDRDLLRSQYLEALEQIEVLEKRLDWTVAEATREKDESLTLAEERANQLNILVTESNKDRDLLRSQYLEAAEQIEVLSKQLDWTVAEVNREKVESFTRVQEMRDKLLSCEVREQTLKREMEMVAKGFSKILDDFEGRVSRSIKSNNLRLEDAGSNLNALTEMANVLAKTGLMYKNKLERRCTDLHMAESEVDLLGDEVETLLGLLGKIYVALDHYSPVLKHYPGIIEILELVRRELTGESTLWNTIAK